MPFSLFKPPSFITSRTFSLVSFKFYIDMHAYHFQHYRLIRRHPVARPHTPLAVWGPSATRATAARMASTAPALSLLSWSVDAAGQTHHRCKRRLTLAERIPLLQRTISEAAPDIVALQDSSLEVAEALCSPQSSSTVEGDHIGPGRSALLEGTETEQLPLNKGRGECRYQCIGSTRNGRCGHIQLFRRIDSLWDGRLLPTSPCLTAEFVLNASGSDGGLRFVLSNVDLTYRGKSLGLGGRPLAPLEVSSGGSPFTLQVGKDEATPGRQPQLQRVRGRLDPHREIALEFISKVAKPDILLGNFFMSQSETMPGYEDAWVLAGAPAEHERTANTFAHHKHDAQTNFFYFVSDDALKTVPEGSSSTRLPPPTSIAGAPADTGIEPPANDCRLSIENTDCIDGKHKSMVSWPDTETVGEASGCVTPQIAGRFQRCFFRSLPSKHHKREHPLVRRYGRRQLLVLKPFTDARLTENEARRLGSDPEKLVRCSASDTYPILVLLS